jgi:hypothetical protein
LRPAAKEDGVRDNTGAGPPSLLPPTGQSAVTLETASVIASGADLAEGATGDVVQLPPGIVSPASDRPIISDAAGVQQAGADLTKETAGKRVVPRVVVSPPTR